MKLLAIETSTEKSSVALKIDDHLFEETWTDQKQAQKILLAIEKILQASSTRLEALDGIVFGCGPGSFTGLRIACSITKGLAYGASLPVYPVSTLLAITQVVRNQSPSAHLPILTMLDARMQEWYWAFYPENSWQAEAQVSPASMVHMTDKTACILAGVGYDVDYENLSDTIKNQIVEKIPAYPTAACMIQLVEAGKVSGINVAQAEPSYIRNSVIQNAKTRATGDNHG